jgi:phage terminase large subunit-like protein
MPPPAFAETTDEPTFAEMPPEALTVAVIGCDETLAVICVMRTPLPFR